MAADRELEDRLMDEYALSYGHQPTENWILIVHTDDSSEFYPFEDPAEMWCCDFKSVVRRQIGEEVRHLEAAAGTGNGGS